VLACLIDTGGQSRLAYLVAGRVKGLCPNLLRSSVTAVAVDMLPLRVARLGWRLIPQKVIVLFQSSAVFSRDLLGCVLLGRTAVGKLRSRPHHCSPVQNESGYKAGSLNKPASPGDSKYVKQLEAENTRLKQRLERAETIIDVQKKLCDLLGLSMDSAHQS